MIARLSNCFNVWRRLDMKKKWKAGYYLYNLTEWVEKTFYTEIGAVLYGLYTGKHLGFRTYVNEI